jgi:Protein of unknown function (DUF742)
VTAPRDRWLDREAGPVVRPYAVTRGRTGTAASIGLIDMVVAVAGAQPAGPHPGGPMRGGRPPAGRPRLGPEHRQILARCRQPAAVVDLASDIDLPVGVVRVLLSDLREHGLIRVLAAQRGPVTNTRLLREVLDGLQAL